MLVKEARINLQQQLEWTANHVFGEPNDNAQVSKICNFLKRRRNYGLGITHLACMVMYLLSKLFHSQ